MEENYIELGKLNKEHLYKYFSVNTDKLIITKERIKHINERHKKDFDIYGKYISKIIENPDYILEDIENENTVLYLKEINSLNLQIVIKLQLDNKENKYNSIITFWNMRRRSYNQIIRKNKIIYKN